MIRQIPPVGQFKQQLRTALTQETEQYRMASFHNIANDIAIGISQPDRIDESRQRQSWDKGRSHRWTHIVYIPLIKVIDHPFPLPNKIEDDLLFYDRRAGVDKFYSVSNDQENFNHRIRSAGRMAQPGGKFETVLEEMTDVHRTYPYHKY